MMKKVYLFCSAGMSTSMLASAMQDVANEHKLPIKVAAHPIEKMGRILKVTNQTAYFLAPKYSICMMKL